jgi:hypothetical protein
MAVIDVVVNGAALLGSLALHGHYGEQYNTASAGGFFGNLIRFTVGATLL